MTSRPSQIECDAILFDLDGVLIDSTESVARHWQQWAEAHGLDVDKIMQVAFGVRTVETMRRVAPQLDAEAEAAAFGANEVTDTAGVTPIAGAAELLAELPESRWAIVTSCSAELARARLRQAGLPIPAVLITADDIQHGKPAPDPYLEAARRLGRAAARCIVIEDAPAGVESGKNAGMQVIGLTTTHGRFGLLAIGADFVIDQLSQLEIREMASQSGLSVRLK